MPKFKALLNLIARLQRWMDSVPGQTFLNYAYSWGASIVILGALFKLTHLPGGNLMLFIGMGTEVVVFFLAAFDRPFDKNEIDKELSKHYISDAELEAQEQAAALAVQGTGVSVAPVVIGAGSPQTDAEADHPSQAGFDKDKRKRPSQRKRPFRRNPCRGTTEYAACRPYHD